MSGYNGRHGSTNWAPEDCEWCCDKCGTILNLQDGFDVSSGMWVCKECDYPNDVSSNNIVGDIEDLDDDNDDYFASNKYYDDEENRKKEEDEEKFYLGLDPLEY